MEKRPDKNTKPIKKTDMHTDTTFRKRRYYSQADTNTQYVVTTKVDINTGAEYYETIAKYIADMDDGRTQTHQGSHNVTYFKEQEKEYRYRSTFDQIESIYITNLNK